MDNVETFDDLKNYWFDNQESLKEMEKKSPSRYKNVLEQFSSKKKSFN